MLGLEQKETKTSDRPITDLLQIDAEGVKAVFELYRTRKKLNRVLAVFTYEFLRLDKMGSEEKQKVIREELDQKYLESLIRLNYSDERIDQLMNYPNRSRDWNFKEEIVRRYFEYLIKNNLKLEI